MKNVRIVWLLLLAAFVGLMWFSEPAFALEKLNTKKLFDALDEIKAQIQTHDGGDSTDHTDLLNKLDEIQDLIQPVWSRVLPASERFVLVMNNDEAVLDRETGLVWEKSPSTTTMNWYDAIAHCYTMEVGGRKGWRLPTVEELASLAPLPAGHPFQNVQSFYWSATTDAGSTSFAWHVGLGNDVVFSVAKSFNVFVWCVRGGHGYDAY